MKTYKISIILIAILSFSSPLFSQWTVQHSGLPASQNPTLIFSAVDSSICWGIQYEITNPKFVITTNGGENWSMMGLQGISGFQANSIAALDAFTAWITLDDPTGVTNGGIYKTTDGGLNWIKQLSAFSGSGGHPKSIYFFDANNGICNGDPRSGYWEIYTTSDGGTTWTRVPSANIPVPASDDWTVGGAKKGVGNCFWFNSASCSVYSTTNRGLNWSVARNIFPGGYGVEIAFKDSVNGLASTYFGEQINRVSGTTDGGMHWKQYSLPPSQPSYYFLSFVPGTDGTYFITSHNNIGYPVPTIAGSAYTEDNGYTWKMIDNLPHGVATFTAGNIGWSAGLGDIIYKWKGDSPGTTDINSHDQLSNPVTLSQNYPNPFSLATTIQFQIPNSSFVILKIYDMLGSEVATLVNGEKSSGKYTVNFESRGLKSGTYYYRLQVKNFIQVKKLLVL